MPLKRLGFPWKWEDRDRSAARKPAREDVHPGSEKVLRDAKPGQEEEWLANPVNFLSTREPLPAWMGCKSTIVNCSSVFCSATPLLSRLGRKLGTPFRN